jgi:hypothetical protein
MTTPTGPIIAPPGQYTHCVDRTNYKAPPSTSSFGDILSALLSSSLAATAEWLLCDYLLGGKLVCLAGGADECAIGVVVGVEPVGQKTGYNALDNDFSFNVLLAPYAPSDFNVYHDHPDVPATFDPYKIYKDVVGGGDPQAVLMTDPHPAPVPLPTPADPGPESPVEGYGVLWSWDGTKLVPGDPNVEGLHNNLNKLRTDYPQDGSRISIPVVHAECEGSRIFFECQAMKPFLDALQGKVPGWPGPSPEDVCDATLGWIPFGIGTAICSILSDIIAIGIGIAIAPAMASAFAAAWEAAQAYDDLFVTGPVAKQIHTGDVVIVSGRWTWDAGHAGHTELHPVKTIQKVKLPPELSGGYDPSNKNALSAAIINEMRDVHDRWCRLVQEAPPPPDPRGGGVLTPPQLGSLTPPQITVYTSQLQPENQWELHPLVDGCTPPAPPIG